MHLLLLLLLHHILQQKVVEVARHCLRLVEVDTVAGVGDFDEVGGSRGGERSLVKFDVILDGVLVRVFPVDEEHRSVVGPGVLEAVDFASVSVDRLDVATHRRV